VQLVCQAQLALVQPELQVQLEILELQVLPVYLEQLVLKVLLVLQVPVQRGLQDYRATRVQQVVRASQA
jgi:hypothetical protein